MSYEQDEQDFLESIKSYELESLETKGPISVTLKCGKYYNKNTLTLDIRHNKLTIDSIMGVYVFNSTSWCLDDFELRPNKTRYNFFFKKCISVPKDIHHMEFSQDLYVSFVQTEISKPKYMSKTKQFLKSTLLGETLPNSLEEAYCKLYEVSDVCRGILLDIPPLKQFSYSYIWSINALFWVFENFLKSGSSENPYSCK